MPRPKPKTATPVVLDLERYVPALLVFLANKLTGGASVLFREHFGIGTTEWRVMAFLAIEPWCVANRMVRVIGYDKAAISRSARLLLDAGLVVSRPSPRASRSLQLALSEAGWQLHDRIIKVAFERERRLLADLSPAEVEVLIDLLNRLHARMPEMNGPIEIPPA